MDGNSTPIVQTWRKTGRFWKYIFSTFETAIDLNRCLQKTKLQISLNLFLSYPSNMIAMSYSYIKAKI